MNVLRVSQLRESIVDVRSSHALPHGSPRSGRLRSRKKSVPVLDWQPAVLSKTDAAKSTAFRRRSS